MLNRLVDWIRAWLARPSREEVLLLALERISEAHAQAVVQLAAEQTRALSTLADRMFDFVKGEHLVRDEWREAPPSLPSIVERAIDHMVDAAGNDASLRDTLTRYAVENLHEDGGNAEQVATAIRRGASHRLWI